jgi:hypothetical protein
MPTACGIATELECVLHKSFNNVRQWKSKKHHKPSCH